MQLRLVIRYGPSGNIRYLTDNIRDTTPVHIFANGLKSTLDENIARKWHMVHRRHLVVVVVGSTDEDLSGWIRRTRGDLHCHFLISTEAAATLVDVDPTFYTACDFLDDHRGADTDLLEVKGYIQQHWRANDVFIVDAGNPLVDPFAIIRIQHAAHAYEPLTNEIGIVVPALLHGDDVVAGFEWDRSRAEWSTRPPPAVDYGHRDVPRYVLAANAHGFYATSDAIDRIRFARSDADGLSFDEQVARFIGAGWRQNVRTLAFAPVQLAVNAITLPRTYDADRQWQSNRSVVAADGRRRVIYVLNATSVSGGIRTVFEQTNGLLERGFDVEVWSLEDQPTWVDLNVRVKKFNSYADLQVALRNEEAIKVATWWETAQVVWLASVNSGVPMYYVQEFETWFYPDDPSGKAAVAASYRKEFTQITIATYQQGELEEIGSEALLIPSAYDKDKFHLVDGVERDDNTVIAVGRSFFQKNFAMTEKAWKSMGDDRPRLSLFGSEPDIVDDERVDYTVRPSDAELNVLYNRATMFVQTSLHEGFGLPIIEAMAAGCPVITTDSHGNRGFCIDGVNCLMVEVGDSDGLAAAMRRLLDEPDLRERLRVAGLETAARHTWAVILDSFEALYERAN
ncbi:glycosyltransferase family 4 protein [Conyzicola nivalis]|uniref:glycosyltransferase family 4 protein n=1 Tax=Conyzicola nivalis TaxID=1477021 RepID=UPI00339910F5